MKPIDFVEKLQKLPHRRRVHILWLSVFIFGFLIIFLEIIFLKKSLNLTATKNDNLSGSEQTIKELKNLKQEVPSLWANLKQGLGNLFEEKENSSDENIPIEEKIKEKTIRLPQEP